MTILSEQPLILAYHDAHSGRHKAQLWQERLAAYFPNLRFVDLLDDAAEEAEAALVWRPPAGRLAALPKLQVILSLGQGVDHLFSDSDLPLSVPACRIVDPQMSVAMGHWVVGAILDHMRSGPAYRAQAAARIWQACPQPDARQLPVGIYGIGAIGGVVAKMVAGLGFPVYGWSRQEKKIAGINCLSGDAGLQQMLATCHYHVCLLPLTAETEGLFDASAFAAMPEGAYFLNGGRGGHVREDDLLAAIRSRHLSGAALDVFAEEPLVPSHPFWDEETIAIFPHVAAQTDANTAAEQIAHAIHAVRTGQQPANQVSIDRGY